MHELVQKIFSASDLGIDVHPVLKSSDYAVELSGKPFGSGAFVASNEFEWKLALSIIADAKHEVSMTLCKASEALSESE